MQKTKYDTISKLEVRWHMIDAKGQVLGRLAKNVADILNGKLSAHFSPNQYSKNKVVVINSDLIRVTGNKLRDKNYIWHTGYPKGLRSQSLREVMEKDSTKAVERAVKGMLPKNRLQDRKMAGLYIYRNADHKHQANFGKVSK